jgi:outer membrane protein assembly factor BamA
VESRFVRLAKQAYGRGIFSGLEWAAYPNQDGSVDIHLWYSSRKSSFWAPDGSYDALAGWMAGVRYEDVYYGGENKQFRAGVMFNENYTGEVQIRTSWADNTLGNGSQGYSIAAAVESDWRQRMKYTTNQVNLRQRVLRLDTGYSWFGQRLGGLPGSVTVGTGVYSQDHFVYAQSEDLAEDLPRTDFEQAGTAGYLSLAFTSSQTDMSFTPRDGYYGQLRVQEHGGDFDFARVEVDLRRYVPLPNLLGFEPPPVCDAQRNDVRRLFPTASLAVQLQTSLAEGDVPYSQEIRLGRSDIARGLPWDQYVGTKMVAARAEYRFNIDEAGRNEMFVFSDHAAIGERLDELEGFHTYGVGGLFTLPWYGGFKLGAYYGGSFDSEDSGYGMVFGYQF